MTGRMKKYANTILELLDVKKGERVWVCATADAKTLILTLQKEIIKRGAFPDIEVYFEETIYLFLRMLKTKHIEAALKVEKLRAESCDKRIVISRDSEHKMRYSKEIPLSRLERIPIEADKAYGERLLKIPVVFTNFPTRNGAQDLGMDWKEYKDFFFNALTVDLKSLYNNYRWLEEKINKGRQIRIVSLNTDLVANIEERRCLSDNTITWNLPEGELYTGPVENGVEGYITFEHEQDYKGLRIKNLGIEFKKGKIVKFKASEGEEVFESIIKTDKGAKRIGELGFGINPVLTKFTNNPMFDEKISGTMHIAIGKGFELSGSLNKSSVHWDIIKDLRIGCKVYIDDEIVFENGKWRK